MLFRTKMKHIQQNTKLKQKLWRKNILHFPFSPMLINFRRLYHGWAMVELPIWTDSALGQVLLFILYITY